MAISIPKLERKTALMAVGAVVVLAAAGWYAWTTFMAEPPPPPPPPPKPVAAKPAPAPAPAKPAAPAPAPAPSPAPAPVAEPKPAVPEASAPPPKAVAPRRRSRAHEDARVCLDQPNEGLVARCAETYR